MADTKITALTALTAADPINDVIPIVDVSDTSMAASGTTKKISVNNILSSSPTASGALTVTGLVTAGSATITGALTVDTTTLVVDATNDRVGINYATPGVALHMGIGGTNRLAINTAVTGGGDIQLRRGRYIGFSNAADSANAEYLFANGGALEFGIASSTAMTLNSSGNLAFPDAKGIDFSAKTPDGSGTVGSEVLNDYEEGTWSPTVTSEFGTIGTTTVTSANYTKIGRVVSVNFDVRVDTLGTGSGGLVVSLPFSGAGAETCGAGREIINTGNMCQVMRQSATTASVRFYNNLTVIANTNRVVCGYTYFV